MSYVLIARNRTKNLSCCKISTYEIVFQNSKVLRNKVIYQTTGVYSQLVPKPCTEHIEVSVWVGVVYCLR